MVPVTWYSYEMTSILTTITFAATLLFEQVEALYPESENARRLGARGVVSSGHEVRGSRSGS